MYNCPIYVYKYTQINTKKSIWEYTNEYKRKTKTSDGSERF